MSEIALRTTELKTQKERHLAWRPIGSTIVCCSDHCIRRKWLEICCDLVSPTKRDNYKNVPGWTRLCEAWTPQLREAWLDLDRPTVQYKLSRLLEDDAFPQSVWQSLIEPIGVLSDLPYAPEADVRVHDTWLWSETERKRYFIVVNSDSVRQVVEGWQGVETRDADTGIILPGLSQELFAIRPKGGFYEEVDIKGTIYWREIRDPAINIANVWKKQINYKTEIGLTGDTLSKIANPEISLNPRFDKPISVAKVVSPLIAELKAASIDIK